MPNRESQKYTRYVNDHEDDEEDETNQPTDGAVEHELDDYEQNHMQEGRRVLSMVTPKNPKNAAVCTRAEYFRIILVVILLTAVCFAGGILFGYTIGNKSSERAVSLVNQTCQSILNYTAGITTTEATTTTTATTTTMSPLPPTPIPPEFEEPDIPRMATHFLSHFTPELLKTYVSKISTMPSSDIKGFIYKSFELHGFEVEEKSFPVMSSLADKKNPNTVEMIRKTGTVLINNITDSLKEFYPFSGFSPNGTASGPLVYANYGMEKDFKLLRDNNVTIKGSILLIRLCDLHPGVKVRHAEEHGAKGVIFYPDPKDFGEGKNPKNDSLPLDGVVWQNLRMIPGDPSTPHYASHKDVYRITPENYTDVPSIIVQPISANSALELLKVLGGHDAPETWKGSLDVKYRFGGAFINDDIKEVKMISNNKIVENIQNVIFAYLPSNDHLKAIHIGCHYDIKDSHLTSTGIGLAGLLALGNALQTTYPNGTDKLVVFSAFEGIDGDFSVGNEYSQLFSWWLESTVMAYVDMDAVLEGKGFVEANVSPILRKLVKEALDHVPWVGKEGLTVYQGLTSALPMRSTNSSRDERYQESFKFANPYECDEGFNYVNVHGIPSLQLTAISLNKNENFHLRNSQYDTMQLIQRFEDTDLHWSHMIVSTMGVSVLLLANAPLPQVSFNELGWDISNAWQTFLQEEKHSFNFSTEHHAIKELSDRLSEEIDKFVLTCESYDAWYKDGKIREGLTPIQIFRNLESRLVVFQQIGRRFLRQRNIPGYSGFGSHLIYGPSPDNTCSGEHFPFLRKALKDAVEGRASWDVLQQEMSLLHSSLVRNYY